MRRESADVEGMWEKLNDSLCSYYKWNGKKSAEAEQYIYSCRRAISNKDKDLFDENYSRLMWLFEEQKYQLSVFTFRAVMCSVAIMFLVTIICILLFSCG